MHIPVTDQNVIGHRTEVDAHKLQQNQHQIAHRAIDNADRM